jgi:UDP-N-acetyl-2-amino-2-deoxyglucuronate dehydrogenase
VFADEGVDAVVVSTPTSTHYPLAKAALAAGKHVLVEKPLAMTSDEGRQVIAAAAAGGRTLSVVFQRRFEETFRVLRDAVAAGALGRLLLVEATCPYFRAQSYYDSAAWRGTIADDGGALMNQGIHLVDLMLWLGGRARRVTAQVATQVHRMEAEDIAAAVINLENGALATLLASTNLAPGFPHALNVYGDRGCVRTEGGVVTHWGVAEVAPPQAAPAAAGTASPGGAFWSLVQHRAQMADVVAAIRERRAPAITAEDGLRAVALVEAVYRSAQRQLPVDLIDPDDAAPVP